MKRTAWIVGASLLTGLCTPFSVHAVDADELQEVVIFARGESRIGKSVAASEGAVGGADLSVRPLLRVAELLEAVPGLMDLRS